MTLLIENSKQLIRQYAEFVVNIPVRRSVHSQNYWSLVIKSWHQASARKVLEIEASAAHEAALPPLSAPSMDNNDFIRE
ncbi:hypothetical protein QQP08_004322 [Theobroma cacao]|nr:hypothetical protein QQP08_004322 [Theobroma cacao]